MAGLPRACSRLTTAAPLASWLWSPPAFATGRINIDRNWVNIECPARHSAEIEIVIEIEIETVWDLDFDADPDFDFDNSRCMRSPWAVPCLALPNPYGHANETPSLCRL
jgi:hypothetical protein